MFYLLDSSPLTPLWFLRKPRFDEGAKIIHDPIHLARSRLQHFGEPGLLSLCHLVHDLTLHCSAVCNRWMKLREPAPAGLIDLWGLLLGQCHQRIAGIIRQSTQIVAETPGCFGQ